MGHRRRPRTAASRSPTPRCASPSSEQKKQAFPKEADYQKFLKTSGMTEKDILFRVQARPAPDQATPRRRSQGQGQDHRRRRSQGYYNKNKRASPSPRDARPATWSLTKTKANADKARKAAAERQAAWQGRRQAVLHRPGLQGPGRQAARRGQGPAGEGASTRRSSRAPKGKLEGPVKTQFGYYVFKVTEDQAGLAAEPEPGARRRSATCCAPSASRRR